MTTELENTEYEDVSKIIGEVFFTYENQKEDVESCMFNL
jgi:hypothetical protein